MKKFLFNQSFDEEVIERQREEEAARYEAERIADENAPPTYTVEELEAAKIAAHQQGLQEGKAEAMASIEQQANLTLDLVLRQFSQLMEEYNNWRAEVHHDSISMAVAIMRKLAPELLRGSELPQVEHIIHEAFQFLTDQPKVMIRVASELEGLLGGKVNLMASRVGYEGQVVLTGDPELELTDCRISWYAGAVERSLDETWGQIDEMVDRVLNGLPAREHPDPEPEEDETSENEDGAEDETEIAHEPEVPVEPSRNDEDDDEHSDEPSGEHGDDHETDEALIAGEEAIDENPAEALNQDPGDDTQRQAEDDMNDVTGSTIEPPQTEPERALASEE